MKIRLAYLAAATTIASSGVAIAGAYTGHWPVTVSHSTYSNGTYCVEITDDGSLGWPHSGAASLVIDGQTLYGTFQLIDGILTVTNEDPGGTGQNAGLVFAAHASKGSIGKGIYDEVYGGEEFDSGVSTFGSKGGC